MKEFASLLRVEAKLFLREPAILAFTIILPLGLMLIFGLGFQNAPTPADPGQHDQPTFLPALSLVIAVGMLGFFALPSVLGTYREKGILRRLSTTPVHPARLLAAQLVVQLVTAFVAVIVLALVAHYVIGLPLPENVFGFVVSIVLGLGSLFAIGMLVAALSPNARVAGSIGPVLYFPMLFLAGTWLPRDKMPDWLATIGAYSPLGALTDTVGATWAGAAPHVGQLAMMAALTVALGVLAARIFRWE